MSTRDLLGRASRQNPFADDIRVVADPPFHSQPSHLCECGLDPAEHDQPLVLLHHDQEMRKATIERIRKGAHSAPFSGGELYVPWVILDSLLTDEEVGR
jgi:hypothetical protein